VSYAPVKGKAPVGTLYRAAKVEPLEVELEVVVEDVDDEVEKDELDDVEVADDELWDRLVEVVLLER
jgi:hypothetical protein